MSGRIPREFIDDLLTRVDVVDLIDSHVPLKKSGHNYFARCPFHNEKSPSFSVSRPKQMYHCFGCGAGGNALSFLMDYLHLNYVEAIEELADFAGIEIQRETHFQSRPIKPAANSLKNIYQLLTEVSQFYQRQLQTPANEAVSYLKHRGISSQIAQEFGLGYAPNQWHQLIQYFSPKGLTDAGLLVNSESGQQYDRFRHRLMFPIKDKRGRVIGFGGRVLDDSKPKYLNSPETTVFAKGHHLYGLYELLQKQTKPEQIVIVEGYMDVIALAQFGFSQAVATLGTATSKDHLDLLFRFCNKLIFCFDGDDAGRKAAWRAVETVLPSLKDGREVKIMLLPTQHDPDSLVREQGLDGFQRQLTAAYPLIDYLFDQLTLGIDLTRSEAQARLAQQLKPYLDQLPEGFLKQLTLQRLHQFNRSLADLVFSRTSTILTEQSRPLTQRYNQSLSIIETIVAILLQYPHFLDYIAEKLLIWDQITLPDLECLRGLVWQMVEYQPLTTHLIVELYRGHPDEARIRMLATWPLLFANSNVEAEFQGAVHQLMIQVNKATITALMAKGSQSRLTVEEKSRLAKLLKEGSSGV